MILMPTSSATPRGLLSSLFAGACMAKKQKRRTIRAWSIKEVRNLKSFAKARMSGPQIAKKAEAHAGGGESKGIFAGREISVD